MTTRRDAVAHVLRQWRVRALRSQARSPTLRPLPIVCPCPSLATASSPARSPCMVDDAGASPLQVRNGRRCPTLLRVSRARTRGYWGRGGRAWSLSLSVVRACVGGGTRRLLRQQRCWEGVAVEVAVCVRAARARARARVCVWLVCGGGGGRPEAVRLTGSEQCRDLAVSPDSDKPCECEVRPGGGDS